MYKNKFVSFLTAFLAVILSIVFVVSAIATVLCASVEAFIRPGNIIKLVQSIDYASLLSDLEEEISTPDPETPTAPVDTGFQQELINDLMKSETAKELIGEYAQGITSVITGDELPEGLTAEKLKTIVNENMDEIVELVKEHSDESVNEAEIREQINTEIIDKADEIVAMLPSVEDVKNEVEDETLKMLGKIFNPTLTYTMIGITVAIALLIFACRFRRFGGLIWIGVDCIIASVFIAIISVAVNLCQSIIVDMLSINVQIVDSILMILTNTIRTGLWTFVIAAVVCIALCIILRKLTKKPLMEGETAISVEQSV